MKKEYYIIIGLVICLIIQHLTGNNSKSIIKSQKKEVEQQYKEVVKREKTLVNILCD